MIKQHCDELRPDKYGYSTVYADRFKDDDRITSAAVVRQYVALL